MGLRFLSRPHPLVGAPMAGVTTPELAAAVSTAGGLGFLAGGATSAQAMAAEVAAYRALTDAPVALNLMTPQADRSTRLADPLADYRERLRSTAERYGVEPGEPRHDTDDFDAKIAWLVKHPVDAVSFTFGPVPEEVVGDLRAVGTEVGFTVTNAEESRRALDLGATFLVAQGAGAGGHRGTWGLDDVPNRDDTAAVLAAALPCGLPVIAAGGVDGAEAVRSLVAAGATAVAVGTLLVPAAESKASEAHRAALGSGQFVESVVTRAFTGRPARSLRNGFVDDHHDPDAPVPAAYPDVARMTAPIRAAAVAAGDPHGMPLWAGTGHRAAVRRSAAEVVAALVD